MPYVTPPSTVYIVRHAEAAHNVSGNFDQRDPALTILGLTQASTLATGTRFPAPETVAVVLTSPLMRTLETTLAGFGSFIDRKYVGFVGADHNSKGWRLVIDPYLQERSALPCDTGSEVAALKSKFPTLDFGGLEQQQQTGAAGWFEKKGVFAADDDSVAARARAVRERLRDLVEELQGSDGHEYGGRRDVVVVTHGAFMKFLVQDQTIDLPKAGWKAFNIGRGSDGGVALVPVQK